MHTSAIISLPPAFESLWRGWLSDAQLDFTHPEKLARDIQWLSNFYIENPGATTPWRESRARNAYLVYFLPLNVARNIAVWTQIQRVLPSDSWNSIYDFGSGTGTTQWALECGLLQPRTFYAIEQGREPLEIYKTWSEGDTMKWKPSFHSVAPKSVPARSLANFSYSYLEMSNSLSNLDQFDHLLFIEPSTQDCGRALMQLRDQWLKKGYHALAPCTHQGACPLLSESNRDWCHMRVQFSPPEDWQKLEAHLPMKNFSLTYSYLLMSRTVQPAQPAGTARVVGDTLFERGKVRQMICRGEEREFLSWLTRHGEPQVIPHGASLPPLNFEKKGPEVRVPADEKGFKKVDWLF